MNASDRLRVREAVDEHVRDQRVQHLRKQLSATERRSMSLRAEIQMLRRELRERNLEIRHLKEGSGA